MIVRLTFLLLGCALVALTPDWASAQEPLRIPYGVTTYLQHLPVLVGKDNGLFAKTDSTSNPSISAAAR